MLVEMAGAPNFYENVRLQNNAGYLGVVTMDNPGGGGGGGEFLDPRTAPAAPAPTAAPAVNWGSVVDSVNPLTWIKPKPSMVSPEVKSQPTETRNIFQQSADAKRGPAPVWILPGGYDTALRNAPPRKTGPSVSDQIVAGIQQTTAVLPALIQAFKKPPRGQANPNQGSDWTTYALIGGGVLVGGVVLYALLKKKGK